jgi:hypothetical protein
MLHINSLLHSGCIECFISASNSYNFRRTFNSCYTYYFLHNFLRPLLAFYRPSFRNSGSNSNHFSHKTFSTILTRYITATECLLIPKFRPAHTMTHDWLLWHIPRIWKDIHIVTHSYWKLISVNIPKSKFNDTVDHWITVAWTWRRYFRDYNIYLPGHENEKHLKN